MRQLRPSELFDILDELKRQMVIEQLSEQRNHWAFLAAVITNNISRIIGMFSKNKPKRVEPDDFIDEEAKNMLQRLLGQEPEQKDWSRHIEEARAKGLKGGETLC